ncbi:unnamed protein product [Larinioides sclopetarius]|uniref:Uncharacterized protein n=1 Tax=Larinioides sclopetarius TaxID=280406 RepID=A0AAV1YS53_9ARAC
MATECNEKIILRNEENFSDGHRVQFDFVVYNLDAKKSFVLNQNFFTRCESNSTSWKFRMVIEQIGPNGIANIPVTLSRFDSMNYIVNASINVSFSDCRGETFFGIPRNFVKPRMASGDELVGNVSGFLPLEHQTLFNNLITIRAIVEIRDCHTVVYPPFHPVSFAPENKLIAKM